MLIVSIFRCITYRDNLLEYGPSTGQSLRVTQPQLLPTNEAAQPVLTLLLAQAFREQTAPTSEADSSHFCTIDATRWVHGQGFPVAATAVAGSFGFGLEGGRLRSLFHNHLSCSGHRRLRYLGRHMLRLVLVD
jgi:hypothetical protein